jgi:GntR family transcriptional regulator/MocR family aminotransferase
MIPYKSIIQFNTQSKQPLFIQLSSQIVDLIKNGTLLPTSRLPGTRVLAEQLSVHRKTVVASYEELHAQGWVEMIPQKGTFVHSRLPITQYRDLQKGQLKVDRKNAAFSFNKQNHLENVAISEKSSVMQLEDGVCDPRLVPTNEIARMYRNVVSKKSSLPEFNYGSTYGNDKLRSVLATYLNDTRGLQITKENVMITRGSQMGIHLCARLLVRPKTAVIVGRSNYLTADLTFKHEEAQLLRVEVDEDGLKTDQIAALCEQHPVKAVYVTSHHHHPTTVTLSAERRLELLTLAKRYNFAIVEDDYDYDFHYGHAPTLPLASHDSRGHVIYIGSMCKLIAPAYRVGYLVASKDFVDECARLRRYIDRQGDALLELTFAHFIESGSLTRHIKKVLKIYERRRDLFCRLLKQELSAYVDFEVPSGGMAVWVRLKPHLNWDVVTTKAKLHQLDIKGWRQYDVVQDGHNGIRMGFASSNEEEIVERVKRLRLSMEEAL